MTPIERRHQLSLRGPVKSITCEVMHSDLRIGSMRPKDQNAPVSGDHGCAQPTFEQGTARTGAIFAAGAKRLHNLTMPSQMGGAGAAVAAP
jgi:hypothetical protein